MGGQQDRLHGTAEDGENVDKGKKTFKAKQEKKKKKKTDPMCQVRSKIA